MSADPVISDVRIWKDHAELFAAKNDALVRHARILAFAYELPRDLAEDIVQDAWADLIPRWDGIDHPLAWMYKVVNNKSARAAKQSQAYADTDVEAAPEHAAWISRAPVASTETVVALQETIRAITALPDQQRTALYLRCVEDLEYADIADLMQIEMGTVGAHLHKARKTLRSRLGYLGTAVMILAAAVGVIWHPVQKGSNQAEATDGGPGLPTADFWSAIDEEATAAQEPQLDATAALQEKINRLQRMIAEEQSSVSTMDLLLARSPDNHLQQATPGERPPPRHARAAYATNLADLRQTDKKMAEIQAKEQAAMALLDALTQPHLASEQA